MLGSCPVVSSHQYLLVFPKSLLLHVNACRLRAPVVSKPISAIGVSRGPCRCGNGQSQSHLSCTAMRSVRPPAVETATRVMPISNDLAALRGSASQKPPSLGVHEDQRHSKTSIAKVPMQGQGAHRHSTGVASKLLSDLFM